MLIPCSEIKDHLINYLKNQVSLIEPKRKPRLLAVLIGEEQHQLSYVRIKRKLAEEIGVGFELLHIPNLITSETFLKTLSEKVKSSEVTGVIIQQPLPISLDRADLSKIIPSHKDIEGEYSPASQYVFPLVQSCLIALHWSWYHITHTHTPAVHQYTLPMLQNDELFVWLRTKRIVIAGNGITTGQKIATYFRRHQIPFDQTTSKTTNNDEVYKQADIIITGVGAHIIHQENIKQGVILLNYGLRKETDADGINRLHGDYYEEDIDEIATLYTPTPNGLGPIDVLCLYGNLLHASKTLGE